MAIAPVQGPVFTEVILRDASDRVLLLEPRGKGHWEFPGGAAAINQAPAAAAEAAVRQQLGFDITINHLLAVDWVGLHGPWDDQVVFVFDGGRVDTKVAETPGVTPDIVGRCFATVEQAGVLLHASASRRLEMADQVVMTGGTALRRVVQTTADLAAVHPDDGHFLYRVIGSDGRPAASAVWRAISILRAYATRRTGVTCVPDKPRRPRRFRPLHAFRPTAP